MDCLARRLFEWRIFCHKANHIMTSQMLWGVAVKLKAKPPMQHHNRYQSLLTLVVFDFFFMESPTGRADLMFNVSLNTAGLIGHAAQPFYIDFQFNGRGPGYNTVTISNISAGGPGGPSTEPHLVGAATGSLSTTVVLRTGGFHSEFFQGFNPEQLLTFTVLLTTNVDQDPNPDAFSFSILDNLLSPIPTTNFADAFLFVNINSANLAVADLRDSIFAGDRTRPPLAGGDPISIGKPQIPGVPEVPETGSAVSMLLIGLGAVCCVRRRFLRRY
jgi:hypothetical protein